MTSTTKQMRPNGKGVGCSVRRTGAGAYCVVEFESQIWDSPYRIHIATTVIWNNFLLPPHLSLCCLNFLAKLVAPSVKTVFSVLLFLSWHNYKGWCSQEDVEWFTKSQTVYSVVPLPVTEIRKEANLLYISYLWFLVPCCITNVRLLSTQRRQIRPLRNT